LIFKAVSSIEDFRTKFIVRFSFATACYLEF